MAIMSRSHAILYIVAGLMTAAALALIMPAIFFCTVASATSLSPLPSPSPLNYSNICFPALFAFGDSLTDTGNAQRIFPLQQRRATLPPYGDTFFKRPRDRFSDGRLMIDFLAQALDLKFLDPYVKSIGCDYEHGVNFATSGATATSIPFLVPFTIQVQVSWWRRFRSDAMAALLRPDHVTQKLPDTSRFTRGLYMINIGGNDYNAGFLIHNWTLDQLRELVPNVVEAITTAIEELYSLGVRNFLVFNLAPIGCTPELLTLIERMFRTSFSDYDPMGCYEPYNTVIALHNSFLFQAMESLRIRYPDGLFVYVDYYGISYEILLHGANYGFSNTLRSCCGPEGIAGGLYNYNPRVECGQAEFTGGVLVNATTPCQNPSVYVTWDGVHPTDAFSRVATRMLLTGRFITPSNAFAFSDCSFNFTAFMD